MNINNPLIVQSDFSIFLEVDNPLFEEARDNLLRFAELIKSPEHIHTYKLTPISLWNAASSGMSPDTVAEVLKKYSRYEVPHNVINQIYIWMERYGKLQLLQRDGVLIFRSSDPYLFSEIVNNSSIKKFIYRVENEKEAVLLKWSRGQIKRECINLGYPVVDLAGFEPGEPINFKLKPELMFRYYQLEAINVFSNYIKAGGSGIIVLPCGSGKTVVGLGIIDKIRERTLILVTNIIAARQWIDELCDKTEFSRDEIGEYSGEKKEIKPITIATYNILTYRKQKGGDFVHMDKLNDNRWGLIIYDEVHLLPAPVFRFASEVQAKRRLGLTATLIREDGRESDVFSLIGPKLYDVPWKVLEKQGWISAVICNEVKVELPENYGYRYALSSRRMKFQIASMNERKIPVLLRLLEKHKDDNVLIIGQFLKQLADVQKVLGAPLITGSTPNDERKILYESFRVGKIKILIVSKVANFAIDLPDANVAIQISGTFGSRQEEAQRLGRILRPKENLAYFYSIVTSGTVEEDYSEKRQRFLTEQGYRYRILREEEILNNL